MSTPGGLATRHTTFRPWLSITVVISCWAFFLLIYFVPSLWTGHTWAQVSFSLTYLLNFIMIFFTRTWLVWTFQVILVFAGFIHALVGVFVTLTRIFPA